jgi:hypothetical protein
MLCTLKVHMQANLLIFPRLYIILTVITNLKENYGFQISITPSVVTDFDSNTLN